MKNVLVTGGAGFIGSNFIRLLTAKEPGLIIYNLDALTYAGNLKNLDDTTRFIHGDITDMDLVHKIIVKYRIDTIVHFAAESHVERSIYDPEIFLKSNVIGTFVLLEVARIFNLRFHHVSTDEVYGTLGNGEEGWTERAAYNPRSPYSASKASSDHFVRSYGNTYQLRYTITCGSNNYGPYQYPEKLIPLTIKNALDGNLLLIHGDGLQVRDWIHVDDHNEAVYLVLKSGEIGETYNVGGGNHWTVVDIVKEICVVLDELRPRFAPHNQAIRHVEDRTGQDRRYEMNTTKIKDLGWIPKREIKSSLRDTVIWYVERMGS